MRKKLLLYSISILIAVAAAGCSPGSLFSDQKVTQDAFKMDTYMKITAYGPNAKKAIEAAYERVDEIEQLTSATISTSDVSKINQAAGSSYVKVSPETYKIITFAEKYSKLSEGAFDITVGPLIQLWGIGTDHERIPEDAEIQNALKLVGYQKVLLNEADQSVKLQDPGMSIDLGGIAKGYAADEVVGIMKKYKVSQALINLGSSSVYTLGQKSNGKLWKIGIQHPRGEEGYDLACAISMPEQALSTSGDYERYFIKDGKRYHHILNPFTGYPADSGIMSDTIVVDSATPDCNMIADILTKITFISGVEKGFKIIDTIPGVSCLAQSADFKLYRSSAWTLQLDDISPDFTLVK